MTDSAIEARRIAQTYGRGVECVQALRPLDFAMVMTLPLLVVLGYCSLP